MILAVCSDKGSPGVSTLTLALGLIWPGERIVLDADTAGGDLAFRVIRPDADEVLHPEPTILSLAADARAGLPAGALPRYAQPTTLGVPVIRGALSAEAYQPMRGLWPQVAAEAARWSGTVIADVGRAQAGNPALAVVGAATAVVLVTRADAEGLYHLRDRLSALSRVVASPDGTRGRLALVVATTSRDRGGAMADTKQVLASYGSPVPVAGWFAHDPVAVSALHDGKVNRRVERSDLLGSARGVAEAVLGRWPELAPAAADGVAVGEEQ